jgi:hypothetical protein
VLEKLAERLPAGSPRGLLARALAFGEVAPLAAWCEERLDSGLPVEVAEITDGAAGEGALAPVAAEAALALGRLAAARAVLDAAPVRDGRWHALAAWWADQAGAPDELKAELDRRTGVVLPPRLEARVELLRAEAARRRGGADEQERHLRRANAAFPRPDSDAALALAARDGVAALRAWRRRLGDAWRGDLAARTLHLLGMLACERGAWTAGGTALRAALRHATGENPRLLGEIHNDLGPVAIMSERPAAADRHLMLAETLLERCGSRRAVTVARFNRGVLAIDRCDWQIGCELVLASRALRGAARDAMFWVEELELARAELARGPSAGFDRRLAEVRAAVASYPDHAIVQEALAALEAHRALADGNLDAARAAAARTDEGERLLVEAVVRAGGGTMPPAALSLRWGVAVTARALAALRRAATPRHAITSLRCSPARRSRVLWGWPVSRRYSTGAAAGPSPRGRRWSNGPRRCSTPVASTAGPRHCGGRPARRPCRSSPPSTESSTPAPRRSRRSVSAHWPGRSRSEGSKCPGMES